MKIAIVVSCLLALAAARNLKRSGEEEGVTREGRPVTAEEGRGFIKGLLEFGHKIHGHIEGLDGEAAAMLAGGDWEASVGKVKEIIGELKEADKEARMMDHEYGKGLEMLMYNGVEGLNDCHKLAGVLHHMTQHHKEAGDDQDFWVMYLNVVRGNAVCISARFGAFGHYLTWLQDAMKEEEGGAGGKKRHTRSLNSLLREFEEFKRERDPRPTGDHSGERRPHPTGDHSGERRPHPTGDHSGERRPHPTGDHSGERRPHPTGDHSGERRPRPTGEGAGMKREAEEMFKDMTPEQIGQHLYMTASANFEIEAHAVAVHFGMRSVHGWTTFFVSQLDQVVNSENHENKEVAALRSLLLKARALNNAMNDNAHLLR